MNTFVYLKIFLKVYFQIVYLLYRASHLKFWAQLLSKLMPVSENENTVKPAWLYCAVIDDIIKNKSLLHRNRKFMYDTLWCVWSFFAIGGRRNENHATVLSAWVFFSVVEVDSKIASHLSFPVYFHTHFFSILLWQYALLNERPSRTQDTLWLTESVCYPYKQHASYKCRILL